MKIRDIINTVVKIFDWFAVFVLVLMWVLVKFGVAAACLFLILWFIITELLEDRYLDIKMFFKNIRRKKFDALKQQCTYDAFVLIEKRGDIPASDLRIELESLKYKKDVVMATIKLLTYHPLIQYKDLSFSLREEK